MTQIVPAVATGWTNPDTSTWVFTIRKDVTFHNGNPLTAKDVKASIDYITANAEDLSNDSTSTIKSVTVTDANHVTIVTDGPDPVLLNKLASLYIFDSSAKQPIDPASGSGPYMVKSGTSPSATKLDLVAYDKYYGGHIYTRELQFINVPIGQLSAALKEGKIDVVGTVPPNEAKQFSSFTNINNPSTLAYYLGLNTLKANSPLSKLAVRQAIDIAIDRKQIVTAIGGGRPTGQLIPPSIPGYNPDISVPDYNVAKAKALLTSAGYPKGMTLELVSSSIQEKPVDSIVKQLAAVGITLKSRVLDDDDEYYDVVLGGKTDMFYIGYSSDYLDGADVLAANFTDSENYSNPKIDAGIEELAGEVDATTRVKAIQKLSKQTTDDVAVIPLAIPVDKAAFRQKYVLNQDTPNTITGISFYKVAKP